MTMTLTNCYSLPNHSNYYQLRQPVGKEVERACIFPCEPEWGESGGPSSSRSRKNIPGDNLPPTLLALELARVLKSMEFV